MDNNEEQSQQQPQPKQRDKRRGLSDSVSSAYKNVRRVQNAAKDVQRVISVAQKIKWFANPYFITFAVIIIMAIILLQSGASGIPNFGGDEVTSSQPGSPGSGPDFPPIPGFTISLSGPSLLNNGELVSYDVTFTYDANQADVPLERITVFNNMPPDTDFSNATGGFSLDTSTKTISWPLSDSQNQGGFSFTLSPIKSNFFLVNRVYARADAVVGGGNSGNECTAPYEGTGYCSVENLSKYFSDSEKALVGSLICNAESGSDPFAINPNCGTNDYSVGLFQINAVAHCPGAYGNLSCNNLLSINARNVCEENWYNPEGNIREAMRISANGTKWAPPGGWSTWTHGLKAPPVRQTLVTCGIDPGKYE